MKIQRIALHTLVIGLGLSLLNCGKDESPTPTDDDTPTETFYNIASATINDNEYTAPEALSLMYSIDNGESYSSEQPQDMSTGDELWIKINNGSKDIGEDDFYFDWSNSTPVPADAENALAKFVVKQANPVINVAVEDKVELLVVNRHSGQFSIVDLTDGGMTPSFTILEGEVGLERIRGVVYNYNDHQIYISTSKFSQTKSKLHIVNPKTKQATVINANAEDDWAGIADLIVTPENTILATISQGQGNGQALLEFDTSGTYSEPKLFSGDNTICCGLGLVYGNTNNELIVGNGAVNPANLFKANLNAEITEAIELTLVDFTGVESNSDIYIRNLVKDRTGKIYATCFNDADGDIHLSEIDLETNEMTEIVKFESSSEVQYNGLVFIPAYAF
ncbi:hypothetical protein M3P19_14845 [Muricauda sp. 2012CJ35-5]|uniref:Uncharacterized protein n=1 Tax=Flagellimonas spongiicola TaxID=2942208 RepID=A0ABT0PVA1_9FLAO|nr:hypothetical protein [Allomuricauda spongiicola]MCL6275292.1 hypothetical protein [Allomuricauda spongiicola]